MPLSCSPGASCTVDTSNPPADGSKGSKSVKGRAESVLKKKTKKKNGIKLQLELETGWPPLSLSSVLWVVVFREGKDFNCLN